MISERISELPEIESVTPVDGVIGGIHIKTNQSVLFILYPVEAQEHEVPENENVDRTLIPVDTGFLEFTGKRVLIHEFTESRNYETLLEQIITESVGSMELESDDVFQRLADAGYIQGQIPDSLAELMTGWAVSSPEDSVLDIATGSGTLLQHAAKEAEDSNLVGIEIHPFIADLARGRLGDLSNAEIVNTDFFDWNAPGQQELDTGDDSGPDKFDAVIGNPPAGHLHTIAPDKRDEIREWYPEARRSAGAAFVAKAVSHLKEGGRGAFLLPKSVFREDLLEYLTKSCSIHRIIEIPASTFNDTHSVEMVVLTLIKETRDPEVRETGIGRFNQVELPDNARGLFEQPLDGILQNKYNPYNAELVKASHADLEGKRVLRVLSDPPIYEIITSDEFTRLGDVPGITIGSGVQTGDNEFFYFDPDEKQESGIDDQFFRPIIKNPSNETRTITEDEIDLHILDLQPYVDELEEEGIKITEANIVERLQSEGHEELIEYIEGKYEKRNNRGLKFLPRYRGKVQDPDLVINQMFDEPRCYTVEVDDALLDSAMIGIEAEDRQTRDSLARLLNTPLYKEFIQTFSNSMGLDWYRLNIGQLRDVPIIEDALTEDMFDRMDPFFPPQGDNDLISLNQLLIESCDSSEEKQSLRRYLASRDSYAWSWFLTLPEFEEFQQLLESDRDKARQFVLNRFDQRLLDQARNTFDNIQFFDKRRELLNDLLMEFEEGHYRGFLAGIVLQFEGILGDLVTEAGGEITEENGNTVFKMPTERGTQRKNLSTLISHFFDGVFSTFLDETIRQRRNQIAHGGVIEDDRELAIHFFISFYALCNASLNEYVRLAGEQQAAA
ncbi:class I SAM-dependent DNA methyltransferase [Halorubrum halophilum]|uniref:HsdM family class I SAM-dependent methyltransferase n=1 Tax=Halorubrum halophilum TaxID=413816 RepID=UPI001D00BF0E|nr:N-6 DNA methylase [Halorubrum halophilum]